MKILVIDDKDEQIEAAVAVVEAAGHEAVVETSLAGIAFAMPLVDGILSDLEFNPVSESYSRFEDYQANPPQSGLLVAILALKHGKELVICTSGDHHGEKLSWIFDGLFNAEGWIFGWNDRKDWQDALEQLLVRLGEESAG